MTNNAVTNNPITRLTFTAFACAIALGIAAPGMAHAATPERPATGATSHSPPSQQQAQTGQSANSADVTKQHTGSGDTGWGDRAPNMMTGSQTGSGQTRPNQSGH